MAEEIKENSAETENILAKSQKKDFYTEIILMLILGVLIGMAVKTEAGKRITIGSDDYKLKISADAYNLNKLEKELLESRAEAQSEGIEESQAASTEGATCSEN